MIILRCTAKDCIAPARLCFCGCGTGATYPGYTGPLCNRHLVAAHRSSAEFLEGQQRETARLARIALGLRHPDPLEVLTPRAKRKRAKR